MSCATRIYKKQEKHEEAVERDILNDEKWYRRGEKSLGSQISRRDIGIFILPSRKLFSLGREF